MKRTVMLEWSAVAVLLLGCAAVTAGVMSIVLDNSIAAYLIIAGVVVALIGALWWTGVIKAATRSARRAD